jgi:hypothetical protein
MQPDSHGRIAQWGSLLMLLFGASCSDGTDCCTDGATGALLEGQVVDEAAQPVVGAIVRTTGHRLSCESLEVQGPGQGETLADSAGSFSLRITSFLGSPGDFCVDVVVTDGLSYSDTIGAIPVEFFEGAIRDTARVVLHIEG